MKSEGRPRNLEAANPLPVTAEPHLTVASRQVAWWPVHEFITALVGQANQLPVAGTPAWCALSDTDPRKLLALALAGEHHVLRVEAGQIAMAEASREISTAADWAKIARELKQRSDFYTARPWLKRASAHHQPSNRRAPTT